MGWIYNFRYKVLTAVEISALKVRVFGKNYKNLTQTSR